jgi:hypothetical protein
MQHIIPIKPGEVAFGETEVMDRIQQIGFAYSIFTAYTNNSFRKGKRPVTIVLELKE